MSLMVTNFLHPPIALVLVLVVLLNYYITQHRKNNERDTRSFLRTHKTQSAYKMASAAVTKDQKDGHDFITYESNTAAISYTLIFSPSKWVQIALLIYHGHYTW